MDLKLNFEIPPSSKKINLKDPVYLIGSCFSSEIGSLLSSNKFETLSNPFGTIYNPVSIFKLLMNETLEDHTIESQSIHYHWDAHGDISGLTKDQTVALFNQKRSESIQFLSKTKWLVITLGTAWIYRLKDSNEIVANCHKVHSSNFNKELLSIETISQSFDRLKSHLDSINPNINIVLTVSPVRHIKDGLVENNQSKSILIESIRRIRAKYSAIEYFPSYEIIVDELRDYRFYHNDLVHPSPQAVQYVWNRFSEAYFDASTQNLLDKWYKLKEATSHKPFHPESESHQKFLHKTLEKLKELNDQIDVSVELENLKKQII